MDLGVMLDVEKVRGLEMGVARRLAGVQRPRVERHLDRAAVGLLAVELQLAVHVLDMAPHEGDHHVPHAERRRGMPRLEEPSLHADSRGPGANPKSTVVRPETVIRWHRQAFAPSGPGSPDAGEPVGHPSAPNSAMS